MYRERVTDIFFDLDHTLWDFEKNSALTFQNLFAEYRVEVALEDFLNIYVPANLRFWKLFREERISKADLRYQRLKTTFDALEYEATDELIDQLSTAYIEQLSGHRHLMPGTIDILNYLKPHYRLHIITNGFEEIQEKKLKNTQIRHYFDKIINSEMAGVKKPNPRIFQLALQHTKIVPGSAMMIGDNIEADILGAKAVGFNTIHFNVHDDPTHEHCEIIGELREIKSLL